MSGYGSGPHRRPTCSCEPIDRQWDPNTGHCCACGVAFAPPRSGYDALDAIPDLRASMADAFLEYAEQAFRQGAWGEADVWRKASAFARGFIPMRKRKSITGGAL